MGPSQLWVHTINSRCMILTDRNDRSTSYPLVYGSFEGIKSSMDLSVVKKPVLSRDKTGNVFRQIVETLSRGVSVWVVFWGDRECRVAARFAKGTAPVDARLRVSKSN